MARREVLEVTCDRCNKKETQDKSEVIDKVEFSLSFRDEEISYDDLCIRCRGAVKGYIDRLIKKEKDKKDKAPARPPKRSFLGGR